MNPELLARLDRADAAAVDERGESFDDDGVRGAVPAVVDARRLRRLVDTNFDFIWRSLRRLGVAEGSVDDACQQVWIVVARKLATIEVAHERSFLFGTAMRVAADWRRAGSRRREDLTSEGEIDHRDHREGPEQAFERAQNRALLDDVLAAMPIDLRAVFVLFELEEMSGPDIAEVLAIPVGTVSSRLRRARDTFEEAAKRVRAKQSFSTWLLDGLAPAGAASARKEGAR